MSLTKVPLRWEVSLTDLFHIGQTLGERYDCTAYTLKSFFSQQSANDSAMEEDLGLVGASADDTEAELIRKICETELLAGNEHLMVFPPLV